MPITLLLVDGNGTVLDDWLPAHAGANAVLEVFGKTPVTLGEYAREIGSDGNWLAFYERRGIDPHNNDLYAIFAPAYYAHEATIRLAEGVTRALQVLRENGVEVHLLTAAREIFIRPVLHKTGIHDLFTTHHFGVSHKGAYIQALLANHHIPLRACGMVGDLPSDVRYAEEAGIHAIAIHNPHVPKDIFNGVKGMDFFALSFEGLTEYVLAQ